MSGILEEYRTLLQDFIDRKLSPFDFQRIFLNKFKNETRDIEEPVFETLDSVFSYADAFTVDEELLVNYPDFYVDEAQLRERVRLAIGKLK